MSQRNEGRASWGRAAIRAGSPDAGANGDDLAGAQVDGVDTITNILHAVMAAAIADPVIDADDADSAAMYATTILESARMHFDAEVDPDDLEEATEDMPYPSAVEPVMLVVRDPDYENDIDVFGLEGFRVIDVDLGRQFDGPKGFRAMGDDEQQAWADSVREDLDGLPDDHPARTAVERIIASLRD